MDSKLEELVDKIKVNLFRAATNVNHYEQSKDLKRNQVNYGAATAYATVLRELGHSTKIDAWEDEAEKYIKIEGITIDERPLGY